VGAQTYACAIRKRKNNQKLQTARSGYRFSGSSNCFAIGGNQATAFTFKKAPKGFPFKKRIAENGFKEKKLAELLKTGKCQKIQ